MNSGSRPCIWFRVSPIHHMHLSPERLYPPAVEEKVLVCGSTRTKCGGLLQSCAFIKTVLFCDLSCPGFSLQGFLCLVGCVLAISRLGFFFLVPRNTFPALLWPRSPYPPLTPLAFGLHSRFIHLSQLSFFYKVKIRKVGNKVDRKIEKIYRK